MEIYIAEASEIVKAGHSAKVPKKGRLRTRLNRLACGYLVLANCLYRDEGDYIAFE